MLLEIIGINTAVFGLAGAVATIAIYGLTSLLSSRKDSITHGIDIAYMKDAVKRLERDVEDLQHRMNAKG